MNEDDLLKNNENTDASEPGEGFGADNANADVNTDADGNVYENSDADAETDAAADPGSLPGSEGNGEENPADTGEEKPVASGLEKPAASKKTTVVLISIICVLVAIIIIFAVIIALRYFSGDKDSEKPGNTDNTTSTSDNADPGSGDVTPDTEPTGTAAVDDNVLEEPRQYDVTVELGQYKGIEVDFPEIEITEEDVDDELNGFVEDLAEDVPVDRPAQEGDTLSISFVGYMNGEEFEGGKGDDPNMVLGEGHYFKAFEDGLVGKGIGEHTLDLVFPDDYYEDLAGKPVTFVVTINSISENVVPELSDQLIADNTEFSTVAEYRAYLKGELEEDAKAEAEEDLEELIIQTAVDNAVFGGEIEQEIQDLTEQAMAYYDQMAQAYYGVSGAELFGAFYGVDEEGYRIMLEDDSRVQTKTQHFLEKVAEVEQLTYTEAEYQTEFDDIFYSYYGFTEEAEVKEQFTDEQIDKLVSGSLKVRKAREFVVNNAVINR